MEVLITNIQLDDDDQCMEIEYLVDGVPETESFWMADDTDWMRTASKNEITYFIKEYVYSRRAAARSYRAKQHYPDYSNAEMREFQKLK